MIEERKYLAAGNVNGQTASLLKSMIFDVGLNMKVIARGNTFSHSVRSPGFTLYGSGKDIAKDQFTVSGSAMSLSFERERISRTPSEETLPEVRNRGISGPKNGYVSTNFFF